MARIMAYFMEQAEAEQRRTAAAMQKSYPLCSRRPGPAESVCYNFQNSHKSCERRFMSGGGSKPGERRGGRKKGSLNLATRERAAIAAGTVLEAKTAGRQLAKDVLSDFTEIFKSMAVRYQPLADNANGR
jgi:hypothetical protein